MSPTLKTIFYVSLLSLVVGLGAGILGAVTAENYLASYTASLQENIDQGLQLSEQKPRPLPGTYEEALKNARQALLPALVSFYLGGSESTIIPETAIGVGVVVTSDGWVATTQNALAGRSISNLQAVVGASRYTIIETFADPLSDFAMVRLQEASGLPVVSFGASDQVAAGDLAFVAAGESAVIATSVVDADHWTAVSAANPAEQFTTDFVLADQVIVPGSPVVNSAGELIALTSAKSEGQAGGIAAVPLHHVFSAIKNLIRSGTFDRVSLGATVVDLQSVMLPVATSRGYTRGALVSSVTSNLALTAGLKKNDIILNVGETSLAGNNLGELLTRSLPGDMITLTIDRAGEELQITVELGSK